MDGLPARRSGRRSSQTTSPPADRLPAGPRMFLTLAADGAEPAEDQRSLPRRALVVLAALVWLLAAPLYWAGGAQGAPQDQPQAVLVKPSNGGDDGPDEDDDDDDETKSDTTGDEDTGTGTETRAAHTDQPGLETDASTAGETDTDDTGKTEADQTTGRETQGNTDRRGAATGASTAGETDPGDGTGPTETDENDRGTGRETRAANTDRRGLHTGASTVGETDPGDDTGKTERR